MANERASRPQALSAHLGFWMRLVSNHISEAFAQKLRANGATVAEWVVLRTLYEGEATPSAVADAVALSRGQVSKVVETLSQRGLVARAEAAPDRRYRNLRLSPAGEALLPRLAALADANDEEHFGSLSAEERKRLMELLMKCAATSRPFRAPVT